MNGFSSAMVLDGRFEVVVLLLLSNVRFDVVFSKPGVGVRVTAGKAGAVDEDAV